MEKEYKELGKAMKKKEVLAKAKEVEADLKNAKIENDKLLLIVHLLVLILKITTFPFNLYYVELYDRYVRVRRTIAYPSIPTKMRIELHFAKWTQF